MFFSPFIKIQYIHCFIFSIKREREKGIIFTQTIFLNLMEKIIHVHADSWVDGETDIEGLIIVRIITNIYTNNILSWPMYNVIFICMCPSKT